MLTGVITFLSSLAVALIGVRYDRKLAVKRETDSLLTGLIFELGQNLSIAKTIRKSSEDSLKAIEKGGWSPTPDPFLMDLAYSRAKGSKSFYDFVNTPDNNMIMKKLHECYGAFQVVNSETQLLNAKRFELPNQESDKRYVMDCLRKRIRIVTQVIEPSIAETLALFAQRISKFRKTIEPLTLGEKSTESVLPIPTERQGERCQKIDKLFELGLLLATILSASLFQYLSAKYQFQTDMENSAKLLDLSFMFKELTIPVVVLILAWLLKELLPRRSLLQSAKRIIKEFCWTFLANFLVLELFSLTFLGFKTDSSHNTTVVIIMTALFAFFTFPVTFEYRKCETDKDFTLNKNFLTVTLVEHFTIYFISYIIITLDVLGSILSSL